MILLELFWTFFKIGALTFGGGYAMLPLIMSEVTGKAWIAEETLLNFVAVSESTPGPFAINMATYVGAEMGRTVTWLPSALGGFFGSFCATLGVVLPSFVVILIVAKFYMQFKNSKTVKGLMTGLKPAAIGLIGSAVLTTGKTVFFSNDLTVTANILPFVISIGIFLLMLRLALKKVHPIWLVVSSAALGIAFGYLLEIPV